MNNTTPWAFLDEFRGKDFHGEWPTVPEMFRITTKRFGERPCFTIYDPGRISLNYNQALQKIEAISRWLYSKGIRKGDKVAVSGKNCPEWVVAYLGILFSEAVVVPIDYQLKNEEITTLLRAADVRILFIDEEKYPYFSQNTEKLESVVSLKKGVGTYIYDLDGKETPRSTTTENDIAAILFTSGTTGNPKGVMLSHKNLVSDCYLAQSYLTLYPTDVFYAILPIHHYFNH